MITSDHSVVRPIYSGHYKVVASNRYDHAENVHEQRGHPECQMRHWSDMVIALLTNGRVRAISLAKHAAAACGIKLLEQPNWAFGRSILRSIQALISSLTAATEAEARQLQRITSSST